MSIDYDLVVIGSGPAGATAARYASEKGLKVLLIDKRQELGAPVQCSGAVSAHGLSEVNVEPDSEFVLTPIHGFIVYNSDGGSVRLDYRELKPDMYLDSPLGYVVDRRRFDRALGSMNSFSAPKCAWNQTSYPTWPHFVVKARVSLIKAYFCRLKSKKTSTQYAE